MVGAPRPSNVPARYDWLAGVAGLGRRSRHTGRVGRVRYAPVASNYAIPNCDASPSTNQCQDLRDRIRFFECCSTQRVVRYRLPEYVAYHGVTIIGVICLRDMITNVPTDWTALYEEAILMSIVATIQVVFCE
jgi:hypothetical protein